MNNKQLPKHGKNSNRNFFAFLALVLVIGAAGIAYVQHLDDANRQKLESKASSKKKSTSSSHQNLFVKKKSSSTSKIKAAPQLKNQSCVLRLIGKNHPRRSIIPI